MKKTITSTFKAMSLVGILAWTPNAVIGQNIVYTVPGSTYYQSPDDGVDGSSNILHGICRIVTPPYHTMIFRDKTTGTPSSMSPVWRVNGETVLPEEDGNLHYYIGAPKDEDYAFPQLTYGTTTYHLATHYANNPSDKGITASNARTGLTLALPLWDNWKRYFNGIGYGGKNESEVFPKVFTNMLATTTRASYVCDGDYDSYFDKWGPIQKGEFLLIDCGEIVPRQEIKMHFKEGNLLQGKATVMIAQVDGEYYKVGEYDSKTMEGNIFTCNANGEKARYIAFMVEEVYSDLPKPYFAEFTETNMRKIVKVGGEKIDYPSATSNRGTYGENHPANMLDNNPNTIYWSNSTCVVGDVIMIDCGKSAPRNNIILGITGNDQPAAGVIEISENKTTWTEIGSFEKADFPTDTKRLNFDADGQTARYIRLRITKSEGYWLQIADFIVEGAENFTEYGEVVPILQNIYTCYPAPVDPIQIDQICMMVTSMTNSNEIIPAGVTLDLYIRRFNNSFALTDTIAHATITASDIKRTPTQYASGARIYVIDVRFYDDPEDGFGEPVPTSILLNERFAVEVSGLDQAPGLDICFEYCNELVERGRYGIPYFTYRAEPNKVLDYRAQGDHNLFWTLMGNYITMRPANDSVTITKGKATANVDFYTSVAPLTITVDAPDWVSVSFGEVYDATTTLTLDVATTEENREGVITFISTEGVVSTLKVKQEGTNSSAVEKMSSAQYDFRKNGDIYTLVATDAIETIQLFNAAGENLNHCMQQHGKQVVVNTTTMSQGLYILRVNDQTFKFVK